MKKANKSKQSVNAKQIKTEKSSNNELGKNKAKSSDSAELKPLQETIQKKEKPNSLSQKGKAKGKSGKKTKDRSESDDVILEVDDDFGGEEIPDLSEFEDSQESNDSEGDVSESLDTSTQSSNSDEIVLTDAEGRRYCRVRDCDQVAVVEGYCRFHYLALWKKIQIRRKILADGKLERYVDELTSRYPDKFLEMIRKDLRTEKDFLAAIQELEIDEAGLESEFEDEAQSYIDEVRGMTSESSMSEEEEF
jgi:hypothetical protein